MSTLYMYDPAINTARYYALVESSLNQHLNEEEALYYTIISALYRTGFDFARKSKLNVSKYYFERAESLLNDIEKGVAYQWCELYGLPKKAYYLYKIKAFEDSQAMTYKVIDLCRAFRKKGDEYLILAELQQYHNISRIYFVNGRVKDALDLCKQCLYMLYSGSCILTDKSDYLERHIDNGQDEWSTAFAYQLFVETLNTILAITKYNRCLIADYITYFLDSCLIERMETKTFSPEYKQIVDSIKVLEHLKSGDWQRFTEELSKYLAATSILNERLKIVLTAYTQLFP